MPSLNAQANRILGDLFSNRLVRGSTLTVSGTYRVKDRTFDPTTQKFTTDNTDHSINLIKTNFLSSDVVASTAQLQEIDAEFLLQPITGVSIQDTSNHEIITGGITYYVLSVIERSLGSTGLIWSALCKRIVG